MKFWNEQLRVCPKCQHKTEMAEEEHRACPRCGSRVWFFNYTPLPVPPEVPAPQPSGFWKNPTTTLLLMATGLMGLTALVSLFSGLVVGVVCSLAAIGFAAFGFLRHQEAVQIEERLEHLDELQRYARQTHEQVQELTQRYVNLLRTGDTRIEHYFEQTYVAALRENDLAGKKLNEARRERALAANVEERIYQMAERLLEDHRKWSTQKLKADPDSYQNRKNELQKVFTFVEKIGYNIPLGLEEEVLDRLKKSYAEKVREYTLKEEQKRIRDQMREEEKIRKEREEAIRQAEAQEAELQARLEAALRDQQDEHSLEVERLRRQLAAAQVSSQKAKSMAQLTKAGHVYILSNVGSFGSNIYKIGMTRRLEPDDRVKELSGASVPFPFDVHAMISCSDAPGLENMLHRELTRYRINRVNLRKEYFEVDLAVILNAVRKHHGTVEYVAEPEALQYFESLEISPDQLVETEQELVEMGISFDGEDD